MATAWEIEFEDLACHFSFGDATRSPAIYTISMVESWLQMIAKHSICCMLSFPLAAPSDISFIQLNVSLECPKIKPLKLSHNTAYFILQCLGRLGERALIGSIASMI